MKKNEERNVLKGLGVSSGVFIGKIKLVEATNSVVHERAISVARVPFEITEFQRAVQKSIVEIKQIKDYVHKNVGVEEARIFDAHLLMLQDPLLVDEVVYRVKTKHRNAEFVLQERFEELKKEFEANGNTLLKVDDLKDVYNRVMANLTESKYNFESASDEESPVYVSHHITPSFITSVLEKKNFAVMADSGGYNSHSSIICRSMKIPAVTGLRDISLRVADGDEVILDGSSGDVILKPNAEDLEYYREQIEEEKSQKEKLLRKKDEKSITRDGKRIKISANIGLPVEASSVVHNGAEGIGLFRSEFLFFNNQLPSEEDQFQSFKQVMDKIAPHTLTVRTLDVGGDKNVKGLCLPNEPNPFMGWRSIRICLDRPEIFITQLKAILRVSAYGKMRIMFPMISSIDELSSCKKILELCKDQLRQDGVAFDENIEVGIMIEVPSTVFIIDDLAEEVDFFSIGTNDLIQFTLAVDRTNDRIADRFTPFHPSLLRMIKAICEAAKRHHVSVSVCGEMASDPLCIPLLLGMGIQELSMSPWLVLENKQFIRSQSYEEMKELAQQCLKARTVHEVERLVRFDVSQGAYSA